MPDYTLPGYRQLLEPDLLFHPERLQDRHKHPLHGLLNFGPYSRSLVNAVLDPVRVAIIAPRDEIEIIDTLLGELDREHPPKERHQYLPSFPGFPRVFGLRAVSGPTNVRIELPDQLSDRIEASEQPHVVLAEALAHCALMLQAQRHHFDVAFIYLPDRWERAFTGELDDFDLHDYIKATLANLGIPSQVLNEGRVLRYPCRASVMWRLGLALYCKAGGVPWKLAHAPAQTVYVGLGYSLKPKHQSGEPFVTCCSQVFDADGAGLDFIAYETGDASTEGENPFLSRSEMRRVMARSLSLYQRRHAGESPKRVVIHKSTEFKPEEVDGCFDAWPGVEELELVQVQEDTPWRAVQFDPPRNPQEKAQPSAYTVRRGAALQLSGREILLWTQGNAPSAAGGKNFFKEGKGIAAPILLRRFAGHGGFDEICNGVLGLSKMDWNNDSLYDRLPVTLTYAGILSKTIKRMPRLAPEPYHFRFFM